MEVPAMSNTYQKRKASKEYGLYNKCKKLNDDELKHEQIIVYLTKEQKDEITKRAKQSSLSVSKYVMLKVFGIN